MKIPHEDNWITTPLFFFVRDFMPTWTKNPLNKRLLAAPLGRVFLFLSEGKVCSRFQSGWRNWDVICFWLVSDVVVFFSEASSFMLNMVGPQFVGWKWWNLAACKYYCCFLFVLWLCQKCLSWVLWAFQRGALWSVISGGVSRNSRWFPEVYILYTL